MLQGFQLHLGLVDQHSWILTASGSYSSKSAYPAFFLGVFGFYPPDRIWHSWTPRCRFFMWLAALDRCWTADKLARRGLDHPEHCLLCDRDEESVNHLLIQCVFSRSVWFSVLSMVHLPQSSPPGLSEPTYCDAILQPEWQLLMLECTGTWDLVPHPHIVTSVILPVNGFTRS